MQRPGVDEGRCDQTPPFAVRRPRSEVATPANECLWIAQRAGADQQAREDDGVERDEHRRHDCPWCPCAKRFAEWLLRTAISPSLSSLAHSRTHVSNPLRAFVRRRRAVGEIERDGQKEDQDHVRSTEGQDVCQGRRDFRRWDLGIEAQIPRLRNRDHESSTSGQFQDSEKSDEHCNAGLGKVPVAQSPLARLITKSRRLRRDTK